MLSEWGIAPPRIVDTLSEEALSVLVPAMIRRRARESFGAVLARAFGGGPEASTSRAHDSSSSPIRRESKHPVSGRPQRVWGSAHRPLSGAELETAIAELARFEGNSNVRGAS